MTEIAYMVREDWAQRGTAMRESSDRVRSWLGAARPAWVVGKPEKFDDKLRSADRETSVYISGERAPRPVIDFSQLEKISSHAHAPQIAAVALHPYEEEDCEALRTVVAREADR
ncbi:hypothetical protein KMZ32_18830 [Phycicoccus sp. MAQZ13P-2]|uniref:hypothetical protein n=1 Tax=Phycicoccus mangrovi TaxID=2840470 RepID=UPI001C003B91|nr:hypothetical protein [Phycicoccus mangrovi]MBT9276133.1 hypothetical protein [Phycicoccus mangrovi]